MLTAVSLISYVALIIFLIMALVSFIKKTNRVPRYLFFVGLSAVIILFSMKIIPHMQLVQAAKASQDANKPLGAFAKSQLADGEDGIINEDTFVSLGEDMENFKNMQAYIINNDSESLKRMMKLGQVYLAVKGTKINLISKSFVRAKIEISSTHRIGLVPSGLVSKE